MTHFNPILTLPKNSHTNESNRRSFNGRTQKKKNPTRIFTPSEYTKELGAVTIDKKLKTTDIFTPSILEYNKLLVLKFFTDIDQSLPSDIRNPKLFDRTCLAIRSVHDHFQYKPFQKCLKLAIMLFAINDLFASHFSVSLDDIFQSNDCDWVKDHLSLFFVHDNSKSVKCDDDKKAVPKHIFISPKCSFTYFPGRVIKLGDMSIELINSITMNPSSLSLDEFNLKDELNSEKELGRGTFKRVRYSLYHDSSNLLACIKLKVESMKCLLNVLKEILISHTLATNDPDFDHAFCLKLNCFTSYNGKHKNLVTFQRIAPTELRPYYQSHQSPTTCYSLGKAIASLHQQGFVHGDIKMSNFFISWDSNYAFLIDYGLSFHSSLRSFDSFLLSHHQLGGSHYPPWYVQFKNRHSNDELNSSLRDDYLTCLDLKKADVWSWAVTCTILLSNSYSMNTPMGYNADTKMYSNGKPHRFSGGDNPVFNWAINAVNELTQCQGLDSSLKAVLIDCLSLTRHMKKTPNNYYKLKDSYPGMNTVLSRLSHLSK
tara:strand:- start:1367 stop:2989 length:1623 start_codon:yes stop_codon:yes gene_type:complete